MSIKALVFDCDGMIVRSERVSDRLIAQYNAPAEAIRSFFAKTFQLCLIGKADLKEELSRVQAEWHWKGTIDELLAYWFQSEHNVIDERFKPLIDAMKARGIRVYLATNNEKYRAYDLFERRELGTWFEHVFAAYEIGAKKPEQDFYKEIIARIGLPANAILFMDDHPENVEAARLSGLQAERFTTFAAFAERVATL